MSSAKKTNDVKKMKAEVSALKSENAKLKKRAKDQQKQKKRRLLIITERATAIFLIALALVVLTAANLVFWVGNTIVKQDRWVAATEPVIKDPAVQQTIALYTTNQIFSNVDVQKTVESVLPPRADFLAPQLTAQLKTGTQRVLQTVVAKPAFHDKWNEVQARQHKRLIDFAAKYEGDDKISVNEIYNQLSSSLKDSKLAFLADKQLPPKIGEVTVVSAPFLPTFHNMVVHIDLLRLLAVLLLVASVAGAVYLSKHRRRTIYTFSLLSAAAMVATLIALNIVSDSIVDKADPQYSEGVSRTLQIVFHSFVAQTITIFAAVIFVGLVAWISGPARSAMKVRNVVQDLFSGKLHHRLFLTENKYTTWIRKYKRTIEWLIVAIIAAIMLLTRLTLLGLVLYVLLMLVLILVIEVIAGQEQKPTRIKR